jgi:hypothetical protein
MENNPYAPSASSLLEAPGVVAREDATTGFRDLSGISGKLALLLKRAPLVRGWLPRGEGRKCCGRCLRDPHVVVLVETADGV